MTLSRRLVWGASRLVLAGVAERGYIERTAMAPDLQRFERRVNALLVLAIGLVLGVGVAMHSYSGPSIAIGLAIAIGVAVAVAVALLSLRERRWLSVLWLLRVFF